MHNLLLLIFNKNTIYYQHCFHLFFRKVNNRVCWIFFHTVYSLRIIGLYYLFSRHGQTEGSLVHQKYYTFHTYSCCIIWQQQIAGRPSINYNFSRVSVNLSNKSSGSVTVSEYSLYYTLSSNFRLFHIQPFILLIIIEINIYILSVDEPCLMKLHWSPFPLPVLIFLSPPVHFWRNEMNKLLLDWIDFIDFKTSDVRCLLLK